MNIKEMMVDAASAAIPQTPKPWTMIHDLWYIANCITDANDRQEVLTVWHIAHKQRDEIATLRAACKELRSYADLKLQGHRQDYPENHCMVQTAIRMVALADAALCSEGQVSL